MAEKRFIKGLFKDTAPIDQPEGSWRYARNAIFNETDGAVSNEGGNQLAGYLGDKNENSLYQRVGNFNAKAVGKVEVDDDRIILFLVDVVAQDDPDDPNTHSCEIGIWQNEVYSTLYKPDTNPKEDSNNHLNFNTSNPIEGTFKIDSKEDLVIYFTDDLNPPRAFNVSRQQRWLESQGVGAGYNFLYGIDPDDSHDDHINLLNLFPHSGPVPHIEMHDIYWVTRPYQKSVNTGGGLLTGVYYLALAYIDDDFVSTNYVTVSNPVSIVEDYDHTRPRHKKDGAKHGTQTTKAIKWRVNNINTDYKYLSPVIIRKMGDATEAFKLNSVEIKLDRFNRMEIVFSGLEGFTPSSVNDVIIDTISYETAKTIEQLDGVLYLGNLKGKVDLGYQRYANNIKLSSEIKTFENFDVFYATIDNLTTGFGQSEVDVYAGVFRDVDASQSYRYIPNIYNFKGYQRDEVYAFYIAFILKDGSMSYAYHIPGREAISTTLTVDEDQTNNNATTGYPGFEILEDSFLTSLAGSTTVVSAGSDDFANPPNAISNTSIIYQDLQGLSPSYAKNFHFFDFSRLTGARGMNYWENATETYPNTDDFRVWDEFTHVDVNGTIQNEVGDIRGTNVRHHHFPSNENRERGVFKLITPPGGGTPQSGHKCDNDHTEGPVNPKPWKVSFKAYMELRSDSEVVPAAPPNTYMTVNNISGAPGAGYSGEPHAEHDAMAAELEKHTASAFTHSNLEPFGNQVQQNRAKVLSFRDKYPFGDSSQIDQLNPDLPGLTNPSNYINATAQVVQPDQKLAYETLWFGNYFMADQDMDVRMRIRINAWYSDCQFCNPEFYYKIRRTDGTYDSGTFGLASFTASEGTRGCFRKTGNPRAYIFEDRYIIDSTTSLFTLGKGDKVYVMVKNNRNFFGGSDKTLRVPYSSKCDTLMSGDSPLIWKADDHTYQGEVQFRVETKKEPFDNEMLQDVKINHEVRALGFTLDDIKIPKSIADQVQGFRIYHAKRGHSDKTILGQAPAIPMRPDNAIIGLCSEAWTVSDPFEGQWIMQTETETPQAILRKDPFATWTTNYPLYEGVYRGSKMGEEERHGHKYFSYYDFNLLRTKNSLAGATHVKHQFFVQNFAYQGPTTQQPKKMISKIFEDTSTTPSIKRIEEEWGWNTTYNCYPEAVNTSLFIGCHYNAYQTRNVDGFSDSFRPFSLPKVLNQKSISYLRGDSIFRAEALGFGGTVVNEGGDSSIIYAFKDRHEDNAYSNSISSGCHDWSFYGSYHETNPFYLAGNPINPIHVNGKKCNRTNHVKVDNLCAFKTDVYKSIDTQELVWTGFEVVGQDLNNFIFWDKESADASGGTHVLGDKLEFVYKDVTGTPHPYVADFSVKTLQTEIQRDNTGAKIPEEEGRAHIFGGDTFIARYGFMTGYTPRDSQSSSRPRRSLYYSLVETPDNINFRHIESDKSLYFPGTSAKEMLDKFTGNDFNHMDNIKYDENFSAVNDIRPAFPLPIRESKQDEFSTRTHRSVKADLTSVIDNYRIFKANQFKDLPKHRGDLWKLSTFNNLLYFHMEESLYAAKGKQQMEMKDGGEAFVGSGDIFQQEPDELIQTDGGYGGTQSQYAALTTRFGYFFVNAVSNKVFLMKDTLSEISSIGMESWFKDNIPFALTEYGYGNCVSDNPIQGIGFHSVYDNKHKRILLTKREFTPTEKFIAGTQMTNLTGNGNCSFVPMGKIQFFPNDCTFKIWTAIKGAAANCTTCCRWRTLPMSCKGEGQQYFNCSGWTISYYPELGVWGSFHDYIPYLYFNTSTDYYSLTDRYVRPSWCTPLMVQQGVPGCLSASDSTDWLGSTYGNAGIWKHNGSRRGILYEENTTDVLTAAEFTERANQFPFEIEVIHNETKSIDSLVSSFNYTLETFNENNISVLQHGFTNFYLYNTFQISADTLGFDAITGDPSVIGTNLEYLINTRRVGNNWKINNFRDMAILADNTNPYYMSTNTNIIGGINTGTITSSDTESMFNIDGMIERINADYILLNKEWHQRRKFMDKWVGIRLIYDNISNNLLNLYSTDVVARKIYR